MSPPPLSDGKPRVLLIRSSEHIFFQAYLSRALAQSKAFEVYQYPRIPSDQGKNLQKLHFADEAWDNLHHQVIGTRSELSDKLREGFFDVILLSDCEATLFIKPRGLRRRIRAAADAVYRWIHFDSRLAREHLAYEFCMPFTVAELRQFAPVAAVDLSEPACISKAGRMIFEESTLFFKRELPFDRFFLYYPDRPAPWKRWRTKLLPLFEKIQGIPLGIEDDKYHALKQHRRPDQDIDVFVSGVVSNTQRQTAYDLLKSVSGERNWNIMVLDHVPFDSYCELVARSKVTLSIAGSRWECFRHYEAVALGSVPLMNKPTVDAVFWTDLPGELFFENHFSDFLSRIEALLVDDTLRADCLRRLESRIESDMLHSKVLEFMVSTTLRHHRNRGKQESADAE